MFKERERIIRAKSEGVDVTCFATSIWDETLYTVRESCGGLDDETVCVDALVCPWRQAWSAIVHSLIPNIKRLEDELAKFCDICDADEVVLFERATFLVISQSIRKVPCSDPAPSLPVCVCQCMHCV